VIDGEALRRSTPSFDRRFGRGVVATSPLPHPVDPPYGGVRSLLRADYCEEPSRKDFAAVFTKGNTRYIVVAVTAFAGLLASLGGGWFDGS